MQSKDRCPCILNLTSVEQKVFTECLAANSIRKVKLNFIVFCLSGSKGATSPWVMGGSNAFFHCMQDQKKEVPLL